MIFEQLGQYGDWGLFALRLVVGIIFIYHAFPKLKNTAGMATGMGMPTFVVLMLGAVEFFAGLGLILGFYTQMAAILLGIVMLGAIWFKTMKWGVAFAATDKTGWEFDFILLAANLAILLTGGGGIGL